MEKNLYQALAKTQAEIESAKKTSPNPYFKSKYADLAEVISVIQEPMAKNGLAVFFDFKTENSVTYVHYVLSHESGEVLQGNWVQLFMKSQTAQDFGSSATYYKRQLLKALFNIPEEDDDGNSQSHKQAPQVPQAAKPQAPVNHAPQTQNGVSEAQLKRLWALCKEAGFDYKTVPSLLKEKYNVLDYKLMTKAQYDELCSYFEQAIASRGKG